MDAALGWSAKTNLQTFHIGLSFLPPNEISLLTDTSASDTANDVVFELQFVLCVAYNLGNVNVVYIAV